MRLLSLIVHAAGFPVLGGLYGSSISSVASDGLDATWPALVEQGTLIRKAVLAYGDGHPEAAQALAAVVMDRLVGRYSHQGQIKNPADGAAFIEGLPWREWFFRLLIRVAHDKTWQIVDRGLFNRNTTVHQVEPAQLTASRAVQAIMLPTSMLAFHKDLW